MSLLLKKFSSKTRYLYVASCTNNSGELLSYKFDLPVKVHIDDIKIFMAVRCGHLFDDNAKKTFNCEYLGKEVRKS